MAKETIPDNQWNIDAIGYHLQSGIESIQSAILGHGVNLEVGRQPISLDLYHRARHIDVKSRKLLIGLSQVDLVGSDEEGGLIVQSKDADGTVTMWISPDGSVVLHAAPPPGLTEAVNAAASREARQVHDAAPESRAKKSQTVVVSGRLKSKVVEGKPDRTGKPTAWGRLAVHDEGEENARLYIATFHRHTARIALGLPLDAPITAEGYPHPAQAEGKLDTFSVINIHQYPGKARQES